RHVDDLHALDRKRDVPARAGHRGLEVAAEAQDHAALALVHDVEAAREPHRDDQHEDQRDAAAHGRTVVAAAASGRGSAGAAIPGTEAEQRGDLLLRLADHLLEIGRTVVVLLSPLGIVRHRKRGSQAAVASGPFAAARAASASTSRRASMPAPVYALTLIFNILPHDSRTTSGSSPGTRSIWL